MPSRDSSNSTSPSLIQRARALDEEGWRRLCEVYGPLVYRWARAKGLQDTDAADVGQEVFRTVAARIGDFRRDRPQDTFRGWLWTITHHKLGDYWRAKGGQAQPEGGTAAYEKLQDLPGEPHGNSTDSTDSGGVDAQRDILHRALALIRVEFEEKTWQAFWRTTVDGLSAGQAASELRITPQAVRQAKYRVLRRLRTEMADEEAA